MTTKPTPNTHPPTESIRIKVLILGSTKVGKSCFVKKYCEPTKFAASYIPTIGVDYGVKSISRCIEDGSVVDIKVDFYDLSGMSYSLGVVLFVFLLLSRFLYFS